MTDLVSRLLEAIGETERLAEAAGRDGEPNWTAGGDLSETVSTVKYGQPVAAGPYGYLVPEIRAHIAHNDPSSVLRRCAAVRKLIERHGPFCDCGEYGPPTNPYTGQPLLHHYDCSAYEAAKILAVAYGLSDHQEGEE